MSNINPEVLTEINKEVFKRRLSLFRSISTRVIALLLVLAIVWVGVVQLHYAKDVATVKNKYGSQAYCYLCGIETLKRCSCQYLPTITSIPINRTDIGLNTAAFNIQPCEREIDVSPAAHPVNFSNITNISVS